MNKLFENNKVSLIGTIESTFEFDHEVYGEGFYIADVAVERLSGVVDYIPVLFSERMIDVNTDCRGYIVSIIGQYRSYNKFDGQKTRLLLSVFAKEIEFLDALIINPESNSISLSGYICKKPVYRKTPFGRELAELTIAVNRLYGKSDYIPCICWGRNSVFASNLSAGTKISIIGRIQSREYIKRIDDETTEKRIAYEVSISSIRLAEVNNEKENN